MNPLPSPTISGLWNYPDCPPSQARKGEPCCIPYGLTPAQRDELSQCLMDSGQRELAWRLIEFDNGAPPTPLTFTPDEARQLLEAVASARQRDEPISDDVAAFVRAQFRCTGVAAATTPLAGEYANEFWNVEIPSL